MILEQEIDRYGETLVEMLRTLGLLGYTHASHHNLPSEGPRDIIELLQLRAKIEDFIDLTIRQIYQIGWEDGENYAVCLPCTAFSSPTGDSTDESN